MCSRCIADGGILSAWLDYREHRNARCVEPDLHLFASPENPIADFTQHRESKSQSQTTNGGNRQNTKRLGRTLLRRARSPGNDAGFGYGKRLLLYRIGVALLKSVKERAVVLRSTFKLT